ncbi:unnamed protein product [Trichogramma brassicae]|uniref:C2H2-type domain-containing protein n=1 Tax=Trichogramma brassicae TaxID=86971 RepID=A0A6H5IIW2_9HYME|nr:unnamed protein product [Trichogramma brassicae]
MGILRSIRDGKSARKLLVVMYRAMERGSCDVKFFFPDSLLEECDGEEKKEILVNPQTQRQNFCDICETEFSQKSSLKRHSRTIHSGVLSARCELKQRAVYSARSYATKESFAARKEETRREAGARGQKE